MLRVKNLSISFAGQNTPAVKDISFELGHGEILGVVGESGSGKSITCFSILKLLDKHTTKITGEAIFTNSEGKTADLLKLSEKQLEHIRGKQIGFVFQEPMSSLNPAYTCGWQVAEGIKKHLGKKKTEAKAATIKLFEEVQLPDPERIWQSYPHQLSGGQRQRVMIAMALSSNPQLLIADEPTTALDVTVQKTVVELLLKLVKDRNMSLIFISHDLNLVNHLAQKVMVMRAGEIVERGEMKSVFNNPQNPYTINLINCRPSKNYNSKRLPVSGENVEPKTIIYNTSNEILLEGKSLYKTYKLPSKKIFAKAPEFTAVSDVSFTVYKGQTLCVVGESGSGKSTVGRMLLGLIKPTAGEILYNNTDLAKLNEAQYRNYRRHLQMVFQDPYSSLNPKHKIETIIGEPFEVYRDKSIKINEKVIYLLEKVGLPADFAKRYPHQLSGGQRQRVCIARALALNPQFIVCDESVAALDVSVQAKVLNLLKDLQDELQLSYLFITHDLSVARFMGHQILVLQKGQVEDYGSTEEVFNNPKSLYTDKLLQSIV
ncbi:MAG: ABC transporter ATP-binding protein [Bacteroidota bacterium]|nr:ABC transporter ATP-binding protein [Bacteroidota bacterium]